MGPTLRAQNSDTKQGLLILPSPRGNYLVITAMQPKREDASLLASTAYFQIERTELTNKILEKGATKGKELGSDTVGRNPTRELLKTQTITKFSRPKTIADLRRLVGDEYLKLLREATKTTTDEALLAYLATHTNPEDYSWLAGSIDLQLVLGTVFLDKDVNAGLVYYYRITQVDKSGSRLPWSEGFTVAGAENTALKQLKAQTTQIVGQDSLVAMTWKLPVNQFKPAQPATIPANINVDDPQFRQAITVHLTSPELVRASVRVYTGTEWKTGPTLIPTLTAKGDTLVFYWQKNCVPEEAVRACIIPQDLVYNAGSPSDTATAVAISKQNLVLIYAAKARDTTDAVRVSWARLPQKPYYTGIELMRDNGTDSTFSIVARLTAQDSLFYDYTVRPGINYTYRVRPLFIPLQDLDQPVAAEAVGSCTKFTRPLPVSDLQVRHEGPHVRVTWTGAGSPSLFGYYVYRGTAKDRLSLVSGTIRNATTYLDTAGVLSGRTEYFYSVMTMNLTQDTSDLVPPVAIRPIRYIETTYPKIVDASLINKAAWLSWNDVRTQDNVLVGFIAQRRTGSTGAFQSVSSRLLTQPSFTDTTLQAGQTVWYRVAAVTAFGDTTTFSEPTEVVVPRPAPDPVFTFYARNITQGVEVSWPGVSNGLRQKYGIYRRNADSDDFVKIGEADGSSNLFVDTQVNSGVKYVYSITAIEAANRESKRVKSVAVIRE